MADGSKRKEAPAGTQSQHAKKKRVGNGGKWKTPHQQAKAAQSHDGQPKPGDVGIWVTCARHQESRAAREIEKLFDEYVESMYGIKAAGAESLEHDEDDDIEAAIKKEVAAMSGERVFRVAKMDVDCLLFIKTKGPIEPVEIVRRICRDAKARPDVVKFRTRYVNRLTPVAVMGKATEQGIADVAREALAPFFDLGGRKAPAEADEQPEQPAPAPSIDGIEPYTFAIRTAIRTHKTLKREAVIDQIAGLINSQRHKVNLKAPGKVILVDIFKTVCGISVVDGDWEELKKFNLTELYSQQPVTGGEGPVAGAT